MWVQARDTKVTGDAAMTGAKTCRVGGHSDWRVPTIKELYLLINFTGGYDFRGGTASSKPYLDTKYFGFKYGDESRGERGIDCPDWSAPEYIRTTMNNNPTAFGVNFADGEYPFYWSSTTLLNGPRERQSRRHLRLFRSRSRLDVLLARRRATPDRRSRRRCATR